MARSVQACGSTASGRGITNWISSPTVTDIIAGTSLAPFQEKAGGLGVDWPPSATVTCARAHGTDAIYTSE